MNENKLCIFLLISIFVFAHVTNGQIQRNKDKNATITTGEVVFFFFVCTVQKVGYLVENFFFF